MKSFEEEVGAIHSQWINGFANGFIAGLLTAVLATCVGILLRGGA